MKQKFLIAVILLIVCVVGFLGYGFYLNYRSNSIIVRQMEKRKLQVNAVRVTMQDIHPLYRLPNVAFMASDTFDVVAKVDGVIEELYIKKNSEVKAGQKLARISNEDIPLQRAQATSALTKAQAVLKQAENSYTRYKRLWEMDATSLEKLEESEANYKASLAAVAEAEAQLQQCENKENNLIVRAPADGRTTMIYRNLGSYGVAGTPLCLIANFQVMWFAFDVDDAVFSRFMMNTANKFAVRFSGKKLEKIYGTEYSAGNKGDDQEFPITLQGVYPDISKPAAKRRVVWYIDNSSGLLEPRNYQGIEIYSPSIVKTLVVPVSAFTNKDKGWVFVVENDTLVRRDVVTGVSDDNFVEIVSGLKENDIVVKAGTENLEEGMKVDILLEGK